MSGTSPGELPSLSLSLARRVETVCRRFEAAWKGAADGRQPRIEDCLAEVPEPARSALVLELILLDAHYRRGRLVRGRTRGYALWHARPENLARCAGDGPRLASLVVNGAAWTDRVPRAIMRAQTIP